MLLRAENRRHVAAAGVHHDDVICEDNVKMGILAQSSQNPGCSTIVSNMAACLSFAKEEELGGEGMSKIQKIKRTIKQKTSKNLFYSEVDAPKIDPVNYKAEYLEGASRELYVVVLSKSYLNMTFSAAALRAFNESNGNVILVGCEVGLDSVVTEGNDRPDQTGTRVLLNPGYSLRIAAGMKVYVVAEDAERVSRYGISDAVYHEQEQVVLPDSPSDSEKTPDISPMPPRAIPFDEDDLVTDYEAAVTPCGPENVSIYASEGGDAPSISLNSPLARVAFHFRKQHFTSPASAEYNAEMDEDENKIFGAGFGKNVLNAPPLSVLRDPSHVVVCSFLGSSALASLQYFISPLRGAFSTSQPPITILDIASPSAEWVSVLSRFENVVSIVENLIRL